MTTKPTPDAAPADSPIVCHSAAETGEAEIARLKELLRVVERWCADNPTIGDSLHYAIGRYYQTKLAADRAGSSGEQG
jgi:hypothetical protein